MSVKDASEHEDEHSKLFEESMLAGHLHDVEKAENNELGVVRYELIPFFNAYFQMVYH